MWGCTRWVNLDPEATRTRTGNTAPINVNVVRGGGNKSRCSFCACCTTSSNDVRDGDWQMLIFGIGNSTLFALDHRNLESRSWHIGCDCKRSFGTGLMSILGQLEDMVILKGTKDTIRWKAYSSQAFSTCGQAAQYRVVLVDGRFRVAGFLKMLKSMAPQDLNSTQTLHDYERPEYPVIEEFAELVGRRHSFTQSSLTWGVRRACKIWFCNSRTIRPCNDISLTVHLARLSIQTVTN